MEADFRNLTQEKHDQSSTQKFYGKRIPDPEFIRTGKSKPVLSKIKRLLDSGFIPTTDGVLRMGVLGSKTSSEVAAFRLKDRLPQSYHAEVIGFSSFDALLGAISTPPEASGLDLAIMPHAAPSISQFYMQRKLRPAILFPCYTPVYGLATRSNHSTIRSGMSIDLFPGTTIALFPVTEPVLEGMIPDFAERDLYLVTAGSTGDAAAIVADGRADFAVTNAEANLFFGLEFVEIFGRIPMTWTGFARRVDVDRPLKSQQVLTIKQGDDYEKDQCAYRQ